ncbi:MAG: hypothetical protein Q8N99_08110 [Nanoarchaeota archaeon]|nr:hypothetical protein [Nanoarchaeota archaeon]
MEYPQEKARLLIQYWRTEETTFESIHRSLLVYSDGRTEGREGYVIAEYEYIGKGRIGGKELENIVSRLLDSMENIEACSGFGSPRVSISVYQKENEKQIEWAGNAPTREIGELAKRLDELIKRTGLNIFAKYGDTD